jgi:hypothetical protein
MPFGEYADFADCVAKNQDKNDPEAYCAAIKRQIEGDSLHRIGFDIATLDQKILADNNEVLIMPAVIASEIVHQYEDGWAYKPADELEKMARQANRIGSVPVKILEHPGADTNYLLLKHNDIHGKASNFQFVKNLVDEKTKRPCRKGVRADITWYKDSVPPEIIEKTKQGTLHDVSIGFTFDDDLAPGTFEGQKYDYVQRNIFLNHVAAPIEKGRCPGPICGIGYDMTKLIRVDASVLNDCPVCKRIKDVGFATAGKRLYTKYGPDILEVIEGNQLPKSELPKTSIDMEFEMAFKELSKQVSRSP